MQVIDFIIQSQVALAQSPAAKQPSAFEALWMPLLFFIAVMYFFMIRPQQQKAKQHQAFLESLKPGDEVVTSGGIIGRVKSISSHFITLDLGSQTMMKVLKSHISGPSQKEIKVDSTKDPTTSQPKSKQSKKALNKA